MNQLDLKADPLYRLILQAGQLKDEHPPCFIQSHKQRIFESLLRGTAQLEGELQISRWPSLDPDESSEQSEPEIEALPGGYKYRPEDVHGIEWHVNFAAADLFGFYEGRCFAQDEIQVFEHPALGGVREALLDKGLSTWVTDAEGPTPFLIRGVERRLKIKTRVRYESSWTKGLYGRYFGRAPYQEVMDRLDVLEPPTVSDILVMEAPRDGHGPYQADEIRFALRAAYTGFRSALLETRRLVPGGECVIHTGFWGCGAYGGNHEIMSVIQLLAARMAGVDKVVFYTWDKLGADWFSAGERVAEVIAAGVEQLTADEVIGALIARGYEWGTSDGN